MTMPTNKGCILHDIGVYSDLKIKCGTSAKDIHRSIVCTRSDFFGAACKPDAFKVRDHCDRKITFADSR